MSTTTGLPPNVAEYLDALRAELADLAPEERDDLLSEVEPSLLEAAADGDEPLAARLGPPVHFAADLRTSAGLPPAAPAPPVRRSSWRDLTSRVTTDRTLAVLRELAPVWWVARAYIAVQIVAILVAEGPEEAAVISRYPELPRFGGVALGLVVLALAIAGSIAAGIAARRRPDQWRHTRIAVNVLLAILAFPVAQELKAAADYRVPMSEVVVDDGTVAAPVGDLTYQGTPVENVYAYDRNGRLLHDVRLYDSFGTALDVGGDLPNSDRRPVRDASGAELFNAFPIRYFEPGTQRVANPNAGAPASPGKITTPALPEGP